MKGYLLAVLLIGAGLLSALMFWAGTGWQQGRDAKVQLAEKASALTATQKDLIDYHTRMQAAAKQFESDAAQLHAIAEGYANARTQDVLFYQTLDGRFDAFFAAHPALDACDIGPDGLRLWNDANQGDFIEPADGGAGAATPANRSQPVGRVPTAAAGHQRQAAGAGAQPPSGVGVLQRLSKTPQRVGPSREGARSAGSGTPGAQPHKPEALIAKRGSA